MKTREWRLALTMSVALGSAAPVVAREPERSVAALEARLEPGTRVEVVDREGKVVRGDFVRADDQAVLITGYGGVESSLVPAASVVSVARIGDPLKNGMLIGAGVGVLGAIGFLADDTGECPSNGCKVAFAISSVGIYTGIGALVDRAMKGREIVYRAPSERVSWSVTPHPVAQGAGVRLVVRVLNRVPRRRA